MFDLLTKLVKLNAKILSQKMAWIRMGKTTTNKR